MKGDRLPQIVGRRERMTSDSTAEPGAGLKASPARVWTQHICIRSFLLQRAADENTVLHKLNFGPGDGASTCHSKANQKKM